MSRPTERPPAVVETLRDPEVVDWIDRHPRAAVLFWDDADDACARLRARLEVMAAAADVPVAAVDVKSNALVAQALGVKSVPSVIVFRGGDVVERLMGVVPESILREALAPR